MWKFVQGFNYETSGMYSSDDAALYSGDKDAAKEEFLNRVGQVEKIPLLFLKKIKILWFNSDLTWSIDSINGTFIFKVLNTINQLLINLKFYVILFIDKIYEKETI